VSRGLRVCVYSYVKAWNRLGALQSFTKEYYKARESYAKALEIEPENPEAMAGLQRALEGVRDVATGTCGWV
jgi:stress-induced-phosphoprotein 1